VDAAFLAHGLLRSRTQIWDNLDSLTQQRLIDALKSSRVIVPLENNWVLFSAMVECAIKEFTGEWEYDKVEYALDRHDQWYKGDGWYGDGPQFHLDYYNSYVIQPMLVDVTAVLKANSHKDELYAKYGSMYETFLRRMSRFAHQQEMLISPEATYPMLGRSCGYRYGAFHALAHTALLESLSDKLSPAGVRSALTAVIKRQTVKQMFDSEGWLTLGFYGHQPKVAESYVSTGRAYLCAFVFLPLGLPADNEFWTGKSEKWSSQKIWSAEQVVRDSAINF
jgi:hypothetical protein